MPDKVCIVVLTCNRPGDLDRCLASISNQTYINFAVTVIDNADTPETNVVLNRHNISRVIKDNTKRLSYLFNLGWKNAEDELIAYLADDAELGADWLKEGLATLKRNPRAAVVTGPLVSPYEYTGEMHALYSKAKRNRVIKLLVEFYNNFVLEGKAFEPCVLCESGSYTLGQGFSPNFTQEREVDLATTSSMMIKRSAMEAIGGFDENFMFNHADGDLFIRLKKCRYKIIYNPRMRAVHYTRIGPSRSPFFIGRDTTYFYLKDIRPGSPRGLLAALVNLTVLNIYWVYKSISVRDIKQLYGLFGFFKGFLDYFFGERKNAHTFCI